MTNPNPTHLFISYAAEDVTLARWLAGKLAVHGYPVWFDKAKSLGGEPWPHNIDDAIKLRTFRVLALISSHSLEKKKPTAERVLAQRIARELKNSDFLIPLTVDGSESEDSTSKTFPISFADGWADGWKELLEKLDSIRTPRSLKNGMQLAASAYSHGVDLINDSGELLFANIIGIKSFPKVMQVFHAAESMDAKDWQSLETVWTFYEISKDAIAALTPPPPEFGDRIKPTYQEIFWAKPGIFHNVRVRGIAGGLILKALGRRLMNVGCLRHPNPKLKETFFLPEVFAEGGQLESLGFGGKKVRIPIRGKITFRRAGGLSEINSHYFAFRLRIARGLDEKFYAQLIPTVVFFDEKGEPVDDKNSLLRARRVMKTWSSEEWLNRVMAAERVLSGSPAPGTNDPVLEAGLFTLHSPRGLDETTLSSAPEKEGAELQKQELDLEEPEMEEADE